MILTLDALEVVVVRRPLPGADGSGLDPFPTRTRQLDLSAPPASPPSDARTESTKMEGTDIALLELIDLNRVGGEVVVCQRCQTRRVSSSSPFEMTGPRARVLQVGGVRAGLGLTAFEMDELGPRS